jgi:hypothetical protein
MTFAVAYDPKQRLVLWSEHDGKLKFLSLSTLKQGTLLALPNKYCLSRLHLSSKGDALVAEIVRIAISDSGQRVLAVLDYPKLLQRGGLETTPPMKPHVKDR